MLLRRQTRPGATVVEAALVYPLLFVILIGIILMGVAVFRYQQVAHIAREASRWAACHGANYAREQNKTAATAQDVYDNAIAPVAAGMDLGKVTYSVSWSTGNSPSHQATVTDPATGLSKIVTVSNTVSVTVTYTWDTGLFGSIPVSSTSVTLMSY